MIFSGFIDPVFVGLKRLLLVPCSYAPVFPFDFVCAASRTFVVWNIPSIRNFRIFGLSGFCMITGIAVFTIVVMPQFGSALSRYLFALGRS